MSDAFFRKSKEIANDFIQSIVFLDDKAYNTNEETFIVGGAIKVTPALE